METKKSVKQTALDLYKGIDKNMPGLSAMLYSQYVHAFTVHHQEERSPATWHQYCVARDVFLQHQKIINLESEIRSLDGPRNYHN